ncbi:MAG: ThiF family adenylyltransferase [Elusimicrobia bacterium]|nr:ThiF family adenylyltransferase [Elusimicrobiota bacterium]
MDAIQEKIRNTRVLVAGCGAGSTIAESMVRTGFTKFFLADHDTVSSHNLNRQAYEFKDLNRPKVEALRDRLVGINPDIEVEAFNERVTQKNVAKIVGKIDFVIDTIDFLNLPDVIALHDESHLQKKPYCPASPPAGARRAFIFLGAIHAPRARFSVFQNTGPSMGNLILSVLPGSCRCWGLT